MYDARCWSALPLSTEGASLGFSLEEIKQIIDDKRAGQSPCAEVRELVRLRLQELDERMQQMQRYRQGGSDLGRVGRDGRSTRHICGLIEGSSVGTQTTKLPRKNDEAATIANGT